MAPMYEGRRDGGTRAEFRTRRVEMLTLDGENPDRWIAERYFALSKLIENEKLEVSVVSFEGEALAWFHWEDSRRATRNWTDLKLLLERF